VWYLLNFGIKSKQYNKIQPKVESYDEPPHRVCEICNDSGECLNNIHSPFYDGDDMWGKTDYLDCWVYIRNKEFRIQVMKKRIIVTLLTLLVMTTVVVMGCDGVTQSEETNEDKIEIEFIVEPRLDQDENGYYHLELNPSTFQTLHRLSGHIYRNGIPLDVMKFNWESSHYWMLGDTLGYFIHRGLTDDLEYVSYDTTYITGFSDFIVPTINCCSYSNSDGEVNTMFGPVWTMRSDTILVSVGYFIDYTTFVSDSIEIVLD